MRRLEVARFASPSVYPPSTAPAGVGASAAEVQRARAELASVMRHLSRVRVLALSWLAMDEAFLRVLLRGPGAHPDSLGLSEVEELSVRYCQFLSFGDFAALARGFGRLQSLEVAGATWHDVDGLRSPISPSHFSVGDALYDHGSEDDDDDDDADDEDDSATSSSTSESDAGSDVVVAAAAASGGRSCPPSRSRRMRARTNQWPLRKLVLGQDVDSAPIMEWLLASPALHSSIESLSVCCASERHVRVAGYLVRSLGPSLKALDLSWALAPSSRECCGFFLFPILPCLLRFILRSSFFALILVPGPAFPVLMLE